jgi:uncharacterized protein YecE (DUF72 family)
MTLRILAGASGYSFKEWKGVFYPERIRPDAMLAFYAQHLPTVEINSSFYALPKAQNLQRWAAAVPETFRFAVKAPAAITHKARLRPAAAQDLAQLYEVLGELGDKRGPVLFQLPPAMPQDAARLADFLALLPPAHAAAFEFRHDSWFNDETYALLRQAGAGLCVSEREDATPPPLVQTTDWGYVRLRREQYDEAALAAWLDRLRATSWKKCFVYFMHEPTAPAYAAELLRLHGGGKGGA